MRNANGIPKDGIVEAVRDLMAHNTKVESERLKEEFMYNQKEYKDMLDKVQRESDRSMKQRQAAFKEVERLKEELAYKQNFDLDYESRLMAALTRYNPANIYQGPKEHNPNIIPRIGALRGTAMTRTTRMSEPGTRESIERNFF